MDEKIKTKKIFIAIALLLSVLSAAGVCEVLARYTVTNKGFMNQADPEQFYFECNFDNGGDFLIPYEEDFSFVLKNYDVFGRVTPSPITYSVEISGIDMEYTTYTLEADQKSETTVIIEKEKLEYNKTYTVTVTSSSPFSKTISFDITTVSGHIDNFYTVTDNGNWVQLDLYIGTVAPETLTIEYGDNLSPDNTNDLMRTWLISDISKALSKTELHSYSHYTLIFFGTQDVTEVISKAPLNNEIVLPLS